MLGKRIKELRILKNMTQKDMMELLNISERTYRYYENDGIDIQISKLKLLADYFNVSIDYLVGRTDKKEINK